MTRDFGPGDAVTWGGQSPPGDERVRVISEDDYDAASDAERIAFRIATSTAEELAALLVARERELRTERSIIYHLRRKVGKLEYRNEDHA